MDNVSKYQPARITVIIGAYGSGKSEISVNLALDLAESSKVYLADLDIINPFYRSADTANLLKENGVVLISSIYAGTNVDVPAVPADVNRLFSDSTAAAVLDIGGEDLGARIIGSLKPQLDSVNHELLVVVNPFRPFTDSAEKICAVVEALTAACKQKPDGLIYNPNLLEYTTAATIAEGWPVMEEAAAISGLPVRFIAMMAEHADSGWSLPVNIPVLKMRKTIYYPSDDHV